MSLTMVFLGTGSAFTVGCGNFQSNALLIKNNDTLLIDAGGDLRLSLNDQGLSYKDIKNIYISHMHGDHIGGLEWLALNNYFIANNQHKPTLLASEMFIKELWENSLSGGLSTIATFQAKLDDYFNIHIIEKDGRFKWQGIEFHLVQMVHVVNNYRLMPCFGLIFQVNGKRIFYTADTQLVYHLMENYYKEADVIFHDCETSAVKSGVHAHYTELLTLPEDIRKKMWLYHYNPGPLPDAEGDGFLGFVSKGQRFEF